MRAAFSIAETIERCFVLVNQQNLTPMRSVDEARAKGSKGGKASGEARRRKSMITACMQDLMGKKLPQNVCVELGLSEKDTVAICMAKVAIVKALEGDYKFWEAVRDTVGEKPVNRIDQTVGMEISAIDAALLEKVGARLDASNS